MKKTFILIFSFFFLNISLAYQDINLERTWTEARVYVPGTSRHTFVKDYVAEQKFPVVIYMHGCSGFSDVNDIPWAKLLSESGYLVIMPNSFARSNKTSFCDPRIWKKPDINDALFRVDELGYALSMLRKTEWSDGNIFLMGHSQGAWAVANTPINDVNGVIFSSLMSCTRRVNVHQSVPMLRVGFTNDPWDDKPVLECPIQQSNLILTQEIVRGRDHETYRNRSLRKAVLEFLKSHEK
jgi:poly(3-hydroxybutyrate) depolymerase